MGRNIKKEDIQPAYDDYLLVFYYISISDVRHCRPMSLPKFLGEYVISILSSSKLTTRYLHFLLFS
ncbi:uncharacterized protein METZ01_LOCUS79614 [marine metagenome]|uniref:Uncharacterized protein n=1 Tax=marine metagenome TaxID=408172 RepID=A0A381UF60_9ZZZZ